MVNFKPNKCFASYGWKNARQIVLTIILSILTISFLSSCKHSSTKSAQTADKSDVYYTCSMHPQVKEDQPGKCPICQMDLIAVPRSSMKSNNEIHLSAKQIRLGNIRVDTIRSGSIGDRMVLAGTLNFNGQKLSSVNTRVEGRIEKLYTKKTGDYIHKGEPIYDLYSEQLNNAKQEYITALQEQSTIGNTLINYGALVESARGKLILWGMTNQQIAQLPQNKYVPTSTTFLSPEEGYITALNIQEGSYVMEGSPVFQLADLSTLWAEAQVYTTQLSSIDENSQVTVQIPDLGNQIIPATISFVNPEINPDTRINLIRATIQNENNLLHPGMPVYIIASSRQHHSITIPLDAVLTDSKGSTVWVQTKPGVYSVRMIKTGITDENTIEIKSGLQPGDIVVTSGAYLLNSEYIFENGNSPMEGMKM
jgi:membrane fusion protein, copper/silver efflux system